MCVPLWWWVCKVQHCPQTLQIHRAEFVILHLLQVLGNACRAFFGPVRTLNRGQWSCEAKHRKELVTSRSWKPCSNCTKILNTAEGEGILPVAVLLFILAGSRHYNKHYSDGQLVFILESRRWFAVKGGKEKKKKGKKEKRIFFRRKWMFEEYGHLRNRDLGPDREAEL